MISFVKDNALNVEVEQSFYSKEVIYKCFYWYTSKFSVEISELPRSFLISLQLKNESSQANWEETIQKIKQDLIEYNLREIVLKETAAIRELIVAKAFAYYQENDAPNTEVSDPVGFNPKEINFYE